MNKREKRAYKRIRKMAKAWKQEGQDKTPASERIYFYLCWSIAERCAEILKEECK